MDKTAVEKAINYLKSHKGETVDQNTGEITYSEENEIIEGLLVYMSRVAERVESIADRM